MNRTASFIRIIITILDWFYFYPICFTKIDQFCEISLVSLPQHIDLLLKRQAAGFKVLLWVHNHEKVGLGENQTYILLCLPAQFACAFSMIVVKYTLGFNFTARLIKFFWVNNVIHFSILLDISVVLYWSLSVLDSIKLFNHLLSI